MSPLADTLASWRLAADAELRGRVAEVIRESAPARLGRVRELGPRVEGEERGPWLRAAWRRSPEDPATARMWAAWAEGRPWEQREAWEAAFLPVAARSFAAVMAARDLPVSVRARVRADLHEAFFHALVADGAADLAARVVETGADGPLVSMVRMFPPAVVDLVARCGASQGGWAESFARLWWDRPDAPGRARAVARYLADPLGAERLADAHVVVRLTTASDEHDPWQVVVQNRRRLRGRLRAAAGAHARPALFGTLLELDALTSRTAAAVAAWAWRLAWREVERDFSFGAHTPTPCIAVPEARPLDGDDRAALRTWVLLVALRGRLRHLERWVRTGGTGDRDTTWGRLCAQELPARLRDPDRGYARVRAELADVLADELSALRPVLSDLASLPTGRRLASSAEAVLAPVWSPEVQLPRAGFPSMVRQAQELLQG